MKKKELIWREILENALEGNFQHTQKDLAEKYKTSTSVVNLALEIPRAIGAVEVRGRFFRLTDFDKLLYLWATHRRLIDDWIYKAYTDLPVQQIEKLMPTGAIFTGFSAYRQIFNEAPADYDLVLVYVKDEKTLAVIKNRFPENKSQSKIFPKLLVYNAKDLAPKSNQPISLTQLFVDLWNIPKWYAKDYQDALKEKINGILAKQSD